MISKTKGVLEIFKTKDKKTDNGID